MDKKYAIPMNLQLFAAGLPEQVDANVQPDVNAQPDVNVDADDLQDPVVVDDEVDSPEPNSQDKPAEQQTKTEEHGEAPEAERTQDATAERRKASFSPEQQAAVNEIVNTRLAKFERDQLRFLSRHAGAEITKEDVNGAARLWGLLKTNQDLSLAVDNLIRQYLSEGRATPPNTSEVSAQEQKLAVKEAILDLKESDKLFRSKADEILEWAEDQGFEITDKKTLKLAYMAWKGANEAIIRANDTFKEQRKQAIKQQQKFRAAVEASSRGASRPANRDYKSMDDREILEEAGLSLFIDD